ncbi:hypothetical protein ACIBQ1_03300 [Nonomuraea sp. NPDC050153]|uniref:hypothetical protein n=1 Tax=Nonomuraea sp. NPDC050153 TaxID=3364359 RepID=UPI0037942553
MTEVEETLRRTLGHAAEQAPGLPALLPARLERIHRRRRQRAGIALAAAAIVLVAGGATAVLRGGDTITAVPAAGRNMADAPAEQVEEVWPEAVRKIPAKAPDGVPWRPQTFIDDRTLLVEAQGGESGQTSAVYAYDLDARTPRKIADVPAPEGTVGFGNGFAVGGGRVVWWTGTKDSVAHLWAVPLDGGTPKIVADHRLDAADDGSGIDGLAVANDKIVFSVYTGGVFTVPLGGGTVEPVAGGTGMHLLAWPWIGAPGRGGEPQGTPYARIQNVETGETRTAVTQPGEELRLCGVTICLGRTSEGTAFFRHRDGSSQKNVPGEVHSAYLPTQDRFYISTYGGVGKPEGVGLYDLDTGRSGSLGISGKGNSIRLPSMDSTGGMLSYTLKDDLYLIDLSKIR